MARAWIVPLAGVLALAAACSSGVGTSTSSAPPLSHPAVRSSLTSSTTSPSDVCGAWSAVNSPQALAVRAQHGTLDSCQLVGMTWFVTVISDARPGQVGYLVCGRADSACLDGSTTHALTQFTWVAAPAAVGAGLKLYSSPSPDEWIFYTHSHGMVRFDLTSKTFSTCPSGVCH